MTKFLSVFVLIGALVLGTGCSCPCKPTSAQTPPAAPAAKPAKKAEGKKCECTKCTCEKCPGNCSDKDCDCKGCKSKPKVK